MALDIRALLNQTAKRYGVPENIVDAVARQESNYNPNAVSSAGAIGVMQLMPATAKGLGVDPYDPTQNIAGGVRYLKQMYDRFGSWPLALAAYNAGPGTVEKAGGIPNIAETKKYVEAILSQLSPPTSTTLKPTPVPTAAPTAVPKTTVPSASPQALLTKLRAAGIPAHTSDWAEALAKALTVIGTMRTPSLWGQVPAGTQTEERRHNIATEDYYNRALQEEQRAAQAREALNLLSTLGGDTTPPTATERTKEAERKVYDKMMDRYNKQRTLDVEEYKTKQGVDDSTAANATSWITGTDVLYDILHDQELQSIMHQAGGDWYTLLSMYVMDTMGLTLEEYYERLQKLATEAGDARLLSMAKLVKSKIDAAGIDLEYAL